MLQKSGGLLSGKEDPSGQELKRTDKVKLNQGLREGKNVAQEKAEAFKKRSSRHILCARFSIFFLFFAPAKAVPQNTEWLGR